MFSQINTILLEIPRAIDWYQNYKIQHFSFLINKGVEKNYVVKFFLGFFICFSVVNHFFK